MEVATLPDDAVIHILSKLTLGERCAGSCVLLAGGGGPAPLRGWRRLPTAVDWRQHLPWPSWLLLKAIAATHAFCSPQAGTVPCRWSAGAGGSWPIAPAVPQPRGGVEVQ